MIKDKSLTEDKKPDRRLLDYVYYVNEEKKRRKTDDGKVQKFAREFMEGKVINLTFRRKY